MMRLATFLLLGTSLASVLPAQAAGLAELEPDELLLRMMSDGGGLRVAKGKSEGSYILCVERLEDASESSIKGAKKRAQVRIAEFLGVAVSSSVKSEYREDTRADGSAEFGGFFENKSAMEVDRTIAGVQSYAIRTGESGLFQAFLLSESVRRRGIQIAEAAAPVAGESGSAAKVEVEALGLAPSHMGVAVAEAQALASAKREAIEMVVGVSLAGLDVSLTTESDDSQVHQEVSFSVTSLTGVIDSYREIEKGNCGDSCYVRIRAVVCPHKALDDYRLYLEAIGSPSFAVAPCVVDSVATKCRSSLMKKGMKFVDDPAIADWVVELEPSFTSRTHPVRTDSTGIQCAMQVKVKNRMTGEYMASVATAGNASDFLGGGEDLQRTRSATKALQQAMPVLEKSLQDSIVRQAAEGRQVGITVICGAPLSSVPDAKELDRICARMRRLPVLRGLKVEMDETGIAFECRSLLGMPALLRVLEDSLCVVRPGTRIEIAHASDALATVRWLGQRDR
jgi:hypothetical protein